MTNQIYTTLTACPICTSKDFNLILDLGNQPPANSLREKLSDSLPSVPLRINHCSNCKTVFLAEQVDPAYLFSHYVWVTGTSKTAEEYSHYFLKEVTNRSQKKNGFVVEVASNDGTFLRRFKDHGFKVLGVDPAANIAKMANDSGVPTMPAFFGEETAGKVTSEHGRADLVFARNVIPHVKDIHGVIEGIRNTLKDDGVGVIEFHYGKKILDELHYDSIYHEHVYYFTLRTLSFLLEKHGLHPFDVFESPISGGSLVLHFSKTKRPHSADLTKKLQIEDQSQTNERRTWDKFAKQSATHRDHLRALVKKARDKGGRVIGYGASARSSTMLNFCNISVSDLACVADQSPLKHKKYTPGTNIPIVAPEEAFKTEVDTILLLAWNFQDELMAKIKSDFAFKGTVIVPLPNPPIEVEIS